MSLERIAEKLNQYLRMLPIELALHISEYIRQRGLDPKDPFARYELLETLASAYGEAGIIARLEGAISDLEEGAIISESDTLVELYIPPEEELTEDEYYLQVFERLLNELLDYISKHKKYLRWVKRQWEALKKLLEMLPE